MRPYRDALRANAIALICALFLSLIFTACATKPVTPQDYLQETKGQVAGLFTTIADLKDAGEITQAQAQAAVAKTIAVDDQVHAAEQLLRLGKPVPASQIQGYTAALLAIRNELKAQQAAKGK